MGLTSGRPQTDPGSNSDSVTAGCVILDKLLSFPHYRFLPKMVEMLSVESMCLVNVTLPYTLNDGWSPGGSDTQLCAGFRGKRLFVL